MYFGITSRSEEGVKKALMLLQDLNEYHLVQEGTPPFESKDITEALAFLAEEDSRRAQDARSQFVEASLRFWKSDPVVREVDAFDLKIKTRIRNNLSNGDNKAMLKDVLFTNGMYLDISRNYEDRANRVEYIIFPSVDDASHTSGTSYSDIMPDKHDFERRARKRDINEEAAAFLEWRKSRPSAESIPEIG